MKRTAVTALVLAGAIMTNVSVTSSLTACAEGVTEVEKHDGTTYTYDECVSIIFGRAWGETYDDGVSFPQESFLYHRIREFLDRYYLTPNDYRGSWDRYGDIAHKWTLYNRDYWSDKSSNDDDNGNYTIVDENDNTLYTFEFDGDNWQMFDTDGNIVDTFEPHAVGEKPDSTADSETYTVDGVTYVNDDYKGFSDTEDETTAPDSTAEGGLTVTGMVDDTLAKPAERKPEETPKSRVHSDIVESRPDEPEFVELSEEKNEDKPTNAGGFAVGVTAAAAAVGALITVKKKRK